MSILKSETAVNHYGLVLKKFTISFSWSVRYGVLLLICVLVEKSWLAHTLTHIFIIHIISLLDNKCPKLLHTASLPCDRREKKKKKVLN